LESDICLISNSGAIDYILNLNSKLDPNSISNKYLQYEKKQRIMKKQENKNKSININSQLHFNTTNNFYSSSNKNRKAGAVNK
jgi:hypothetical protein